MSRVGTFRTRMSAISSSHDLDSATATLILGHLSEQNNHPEIVRIVAQQALDGAAWPRVW